MSWMNRRSSSKVEDDEGMKPTGYDLNGVLTNRGFLRKSRSFQWCATILFVLVVVNIFPSNNNNKEREQQRFGLLSSTSKEMKMARKDSAACLLLFDDNHYLIEWLAYHYHALSLRQLIVVTDPRSQTTPLDVLKRWDGLMEYEVWDETRVFPPGKLDYFRAKDDLIKLHRARQGYFYSACLKELKHRGAEWVAFLDVDEYIFPNPHLSDPNHRLYRSDYRYNPQPAYILNFLRHERKMSPCLHMARRDFIAKESALEEISYRVPKGLNATNLSTARFRYRTDRRITGKCLVNAAAIRESDIPLIAPKQGHVVLNRYCPSPRYAKYGYNMDNSPLTVHHYLGSKEQYLFRDDPRVDRTADYLDFKAKGPLFLVDHARAWLPEFVDSVGLAEAQRLLDGAGKVQKAS